jgi:hypothetical protein
VIGHAGVFQFFRDPFEFLRDLVAPAESPVQFVRFAFPRGSDLVVPIGEPLALMGDPVAFVGATSAIFGGLFAFAGLGPQRARSCTLVRVTQSSFSRDRSLRRRPLEGCVRRDALVAFRKAWKVGLCASWRLSSSFGICNVADRSRRGPRGRRPVLGAFSRTVGALGSPRRRLLIAELA